MYLRRQQKTIFHEKENLFTYFLLFYFPSHGGEEIRRKKEEKREKSYYKSKRLGKKPRSMKQRCLTYGFYIARCVMFRVSSSHNMHTLSVPTGLTLVS